MSNQTLQPPPTKRRTRSKSAQTATSKGSFRRQTARIDGRRDGAPLIFGWGKHLTRVQKQRIQQRAVFGFFGLVVVAVLFVFVFGWFQQNVLIPNQAIVTVNSVGVPQSTYQKQLAYDAQVLWNTLQTEIKQQTADQAAAAKGNAAANTQNQILTSQIQANEANYQQSSITQAVITELVEDQLIQQHDKVLEQENHVPVATLQPSSSAISASLAAFKKAFPGNESYADFLSKNGITEVDVRAAIAVHLRRDALQKYLASQIVSPMKQVHLRRIQFNTLADAQRALAQIAKDPNNNTLWSTLAKQDSLDATTKNTGGDMGWVVNYTGDQGIDNWAYAANRKVGDLTTPPLKDASGTFDIVQVLAIDPSRAVDATTLQSAQTDALTQWIGGAKADVNTHITTPDSTMLTAARNLPILPDLNAQLPSETPPNGVPGAPNGNPQALP